MKTWIPQMKNCSKNWIILQETHRGIASIFRIILENKGNGWNIDLWYMNSQIFLISRQITILDTLFNRYIGVQKHCIFEIKKFTLSYATCFETIQSSFEIPTEKIKGSVISSIPTRPLLLVDTHSFSSNYSSINVLTILVGLEGIFILFIY